MDPILLLILGAIGLIVLSNEKEPTEKESKPSVERIRKNRVDRGRGNGNRKPGGPVIVNRKRVKPAPEPETIPTTDPIPSPVPSPAPEPVPETPSPTA